MNARLWEWTAKHEELLLPSRYAGKPAHRIRYREQGSKRWSSFLLITDNMAAPTETMVLRAIEEHAR